MDLYTPTFHIISSDSDQEDIFPNVPSDDDTNNSDESDSIESNSDSELPKPCTSRKRNVSKLRKRKCLFKSSSKPKRLQVYCNTSSKPIKKCITIPFIGEIDSCRDIPKQVFDISETNPQYFSSTKNWENRFIFDPTISKTSSSGFPRVDLYLYAIEANIETKSQISKPIDHRISLSDLKTPIERFYPELWDDGSREDLYKFPFMTQPYENAMSVLRSPTHIFAKVPVAIEEPSQSLHNDPPSPQHVLSPEGQFLLDREEPIVFFDVIFRKYEFMTVLNETKRYRKQKHLDQAPYHYPCPSYEEIRCFIGLLLWTSLVQLPNRRSYFVGSEIYSQPNFTKHTTRARFEQLLTMLHFTNKEKIPDSLLSAERFLAQLGNLITAVNENCKRYIIPAASLSIDEMMIKFYGRSVVRQYIKSKPTKYGIKLWALCCACCGYSLTQKMYLGSSAGAVSGRDVVLQLTEPYYDRGHVIFCDNFFSHLDLAAYLKSRKTGLVGTSSINSLPADLKYLVDRMHPLTWAFKWFNYEAKIKFQNNSTTQHLEANEAVSLVVWMDKKYRSKDKKVVFITNCVPSIPTNSSQFQEKNIRDQFFKFSRQPIPSPPVLKAYNNRMGGVDLHDKLVGLHQIPLSSMRGYVKVFFHLLDSAVVNAWILFKTTRQAKGMWNCAERRRYNLAWFKECVVLSLCGTFTTRKMESAVKISNPTFQIQSVQTATSHQIMPKSQISGMVSSSGRCVKCSASKRTACVVCRVSYCYECGIIHLREMLAYHSNEVDEEHISDTEI